MEKEKIKWHPAFAAAVQLELKEYKKYLEFVTEYQLTQEPLRIDILVVKKLKDIDIEKCIGKIFRKYNIFEYKSPTDYISIDDYYKVKAYAYLYKSLTEGTNRININEMTITLTSNKYPKKLMDYLKSKHGVLIENPYNGIYYIRNTDIETQIIISRELDISETRYINLLQVERDDKNLMENWMKEYIVNIKDPLYAVIMDVLTEANPNELVEVYKNMGKAKLSEDNRKFMYDMIRKLELDKKLRQEGIEQGIEQGRETLLKSVIKLLTRRFGSIPEDMTEEIENLKIDKLENIINNIFDFKSIDEVNEYLK